MVIRVRGCVRWSLTAALALHLSMHHGVAAAQARGQDPLHDSVGGENWSAYGRTYGEQHFSPLKQIDQRTVNRLGLAWFSDLGHGNSATVPLAIDGVLYFASGYSVVHALDAVSGKTLWVFDPKVAEVAGAKLRQGWGSRGLAWWKGTLYTGTHDGRLIALDAKTGAVRWSVATFAQDDLRYITGAPRVFDGKVIIGHGGADSASIRGYVTAYDAVSGKQLWRFFTVPGNPAKGFEDKAQEMAAATWAGEWWKHGGGGNVWNAFTYDAGADAILLGTGNGSPWNRKIRSNDQGDNLFLCSIVALDARTGAYRWHYQVNPGETWDYNASMDMALADLVIEGRPRKVLLTAPKNGFFYVIDRTDGRLISAQPIAKITWAKRIDPVSGRPVEVEGARYPDGKPFTLWPSPAGAHSWQPMAFDPRSAIAYIPVIEMGAQIGDQGISPKTWVRTPGNAYDMAVNLSLGADDPLHGTSSLLAWDAVRQKPLWKVPTPHTWNGGVMATAGNLVFQGTIGSEFKAYSADKGKLAWTFATQSPVIAAPITYSVNGKQYVTVLTGMGTSGAAFGKDLGIVLDARTQPRRVLTFALDGKAVLPAYAAVVPKAVTDPAYSPDARLAGAGAEPYGRYCWACHGADAVGGGVAPDLRASSAILQSAAFASVVRDGALLSRGMPRFEEFDDDQLESIRQYLRARANAMRSDNFAKGEKP